MSTVFVPPSRLATLKQLQCRIFQTSYNPTSIRTGAKYLRARLRGPSMLAYYPQSFNIAQITRRYPELEIVNEDEEERLQDVFDRKKRGKGPPKKAKSKGCRILNFFRNTCAESYRQRKADVWAKSDDDFSTCLCIIFGSFVRSQNCNNYYPENGSLLSAAVFECFRLPSYDQIRCIHDRVIGARVVPNSPPERQHDVSNNNSRFRHHLTLLDGMMFRYQSPNQSAR